MVPRRLGSLTQSVASTVDRTVGNLTQTASTVVAAGVGLGRGVLGQTSGVATGGGQQAHPAQGWPLGGDARGSGEWRGPPAHPAGRRPVRASLFRLAAPTPFASKVQQPESRQCAHHAPQVAGVAPAAAGAAAPPGGALPSPTQRVVGVPALLPWRSAPVDEAGPPQAAAQAGGGAGEAAGSDGERTPPSSARRRGAAARWQRGGAVPGPTAGGGAAGDLSRLSRVRDECGTGAGRPVPFSAGPALRHRAGILVVWVSTPGP